MKKIVLPSGNYLLVETFDDILDYKISGTNYLCFKSWDGWFPQVPRLEDKFQIISTTKDITENQIISIIEKKRIKESWNDTMTNVYINYESKELIGKYVKTAEESLQSLIQANGLDITKNYLILKATI